METQNTTNSPAMTDDIPLVEPIKRGETTISSIRLRKPGAGELRGCSTANLLNGQVDDVLKVLPRITVPSLTQPEVEALDPADLAELSGHVMSFLLTPAQRALAEQMLKT
ncbi:phage tail assembly protein [Asticcacaulis solisilvae]|uniref:phage tail assembly protein n=1 Tax=Asticcacaulis solisilvae TaxID=1217274 RepID=UPI003FD785C6